MEWCTRAPLASCLCFKWSFPIFSHLPLLTLDQTREIKCSEARILELADLLFWFKVFMATDHRGLLLPEKNKRFSDNYTPLTSPAHSWTTWCWGSELRLWRRTNHAWRGKVSWNHSSAHPSGKVCVGGGKERSREGRKKKQQETDIGVNPVWEELWFQFIFSLEMLSSLLLLVWGLAHPGEWMAWEREMRWRINSLQWKFLDHQSTLRKTSYACNGYSGISPVGRLPWLLIWTLNSDSIGIKTALRRVGEIGHMRMRILEVVFIYSHCKDCNWISYKAFQAIKNAPWQNVANMSELLYFPPLFFNITCFDVF